MGSLCGKQSTTKQSNVDKQKLNNVESDNDTDDSKYNYNECKHTINEDGSVSFYPSPHLKESDLGTQLLNTTSFLKSQKLRDIKQKIKWKELEAIHDFDVEIIDDYTSNISSFVLGALKAFNKHYP
eukprot:499088_1